MFAALTTEDRKNCAGFANLESLSLLHGASCPLIVMDEPTASLDFGNQVAVLAKIRKLGARGAGVISPRAIPIRPLPNRVALMQYGTIVAQGAPSEVLTAVRLKAVYGIDVTVERLTDA